VFRAHSGNVYPVQANVYEDVSVEKRRQAEHLIHEEAIQQARLALLGPNPDAGRREALAILEQALRGAR